MRISSGLAACNSGLSPLAIKSCSAAGTAARCGAGALGRDSETPGRPEAARFPAPGRGRRTVPSCGAKGSFGLSLLMPSYPWDSRLAADRPKFHLQAGEIPTDVQPDAARRLQLTPHVARLIELEIDVARVIGNLSWRNGDRLQSNAWQREIDELADGFDGADF